MKKIKLIALITILLVGCSKKTSSSSTVTTTSTSTITQTNETTTKESEETTTEKEMISLTISLNTTEYTASIDNDNYSIEVSNDKNYTYIYLKISIIEGTFDSNYEFIVNGEKKDIYSTNDENTEITIRIKDPNWSEIV